MKPKFEMDGNGMFRIGIQGQWSDWVGYRNIAQLRYNGVLYIGVSQYFESRDGLSPERIYQVAMV